MKKAGFEALMRRLARAWNAGDAEAAAACFAEGVDYADPLRYRFSSRADLVPFFDPGPDGHSVTWHRLIFDEAASTGVVEYTYVGDHRYHGAAIVRIDQDGRVSRWREWQHESDVRDWDAFIDARPTDT